jgi:hypothetical protein
MQFGTSMMFKGRQSLALLWYEVGTTSRYREVGLTSWARSLY